MRLLRPPTLTVAAAMGAANRADVHHLAPIPDDQAEDEACKSVRSLCQMLNVIRALPRQWPCRWQAPSGIGRTTEQTTDG